ncbi:hypothetical protein GJAV_G00119910 [Gymnothorax javanicus]|nr:hypothetical protein GJAV_G00119910 [Gymnothorax javanicus]
MTHWVNLLSEGQSRAHVNVCLFVILAVAPPTNLHVRGVTERTIDLEWEGSPILTDYLVTYAPSSPGGVQLDIRVPGNITSCTIAELEPGIEYNLNVYAVLDTVISSPASTQVSTCK